MIGIDYSQAAVRAAQHRADELAAACRYVAAAVPGVPLASGSADLVYTGKGALIWLPDLTGWACDVARLLRPSGHLARPIAIGPLRSSATEPVLSWRNARWETCKDLGQPAHHGMVTGMASKKVTITLDEAQLERIRALVEAGVAPSVSGFVQHAVSVSLDDVAGWGALLAEALQESGGALSDSERAWADEVLGVTQRGGRPAA